MTTKQIIIPCHDLLAMIEEIYREEGAACWNNKLDGMIRDLAHHYHSFSREELIELMVGSLGFDATAYYQRLEYMVDTFLRLVDLTRIAPDHTDNRLVIQYDSHDECLILELTELSKVMKQESRLQHMIEAWMSDVREAMDNGDYVPEYQRRLVS